MYLWNICLPLHAYIDSFFIPFQSPNCSVFFASPECLGIGFRRFFCRPAEEPASFTSLVLAPGSWQM